MDVLDVVVLAGRGSARASEDRGAWLKAGAARVFVPIRLWSTFPFLDAVVVGVTHDPHEVGGAHWPRRTFLAAGGDISFIYFLHISLAAGRYFGKFLRSLNSCGPQSQVLSTSFWRGLHFPRCQGQNLDFCRSRRSSWRAQRAIFQGFGLSGT